MAFQNSATRAASYPSFFSPSSVVMLFVRRHHINPTRTRIRESIDVRDGENKRAMRTHADDGRAAEVLLVLDLLGYIEPPTALHSVGRHTAPLPVVVSS
jgi:hypothetical protein